MNLSEAKKVMIRHLKTTIVPDLKGMGFIGTFPHFRRERNGRYEFVSFQFWSTGGRFVIECGSGTPKDFEYPLAKDLPFEKLHYGHTYPTTRRRIRPNDTVGDYWFTFSDFIDDIEFVNLAQFVKSLLPKIEEFFAQ